jgi:hypothetical protein
VRVDPDAFVAKDRAAAKSPRFVVKIEFPSVSLYLSSHSDITGIPATHIAACLVEPSITSQKLNPDQGRAEIGEASFTVADRNTEFSDNVRALNNVGQGLRDRWCRFYLGYEGMAWSEFQLIGTQQIKAASFDKGAYRISCNDIQRAARKDILDLAATTIASTVEATDTTINVVSTAGFTTVNHGSNYTDAPSSTVGYVKIKDEVIRYTGKTTTSFTGCTRGVLGTAAARYVADGATQAARREKVSEYVYLELPGPKLAYALLTGVLYSDSANLPASWHLGIPTSLVRLSDFTGIGPDLWNPADDTHGVVLRFEGIGKTDGKAFIETEINLLLGLFMPVYATGELGLKRMTRVLSDASGVVTLDESNSVSVGELEHDMDSLHNAFQINWNWNGKDYSRTTVYIDANSVSKHGRASTKDLKFKGLYGGRHTDGMLFKLLDSIRDRFSGPPLRHRREVFHSLNRLDVGDVVRVRDPNVRDFTGPVDTIDRAFEIQSVSVNHRTGAVSLDLFGSTDRASVITPTGSTSALPDSGFYTAQGTNLTGVMTITGGVVSGGPYTLAGGTDLTAAGSTWYYDGDLTIGSGVTVNISGNVQLRVKGYLTINGTINGVGGGKAGVADNGTTTVIGGNPGWVGNSRGNDGVRRIDLSGDNAKLQTQAPALTQAAHASFPFMDLTVSGTSLLGLPTDIRGTGGGPGGKVVHANGTFYKNGGTGGAGGAGLCTVSRGLGIGANATINLSGAATTAPSAHLWNNADGRSVNAFPGAGGGGGPGGWLLLIDGSLLSVPDLSGRFVARTGAVGVPAYETALTGTGVEKYQLKLEPFAGYLDEPSVISDLDLSFSASRIQYIPAPETAAVDVVTIAPVTDLTVTQGSSGYSLRFTPAPGTPAGTVFEVWEHTSATPFASAVKAGEIAGTLLFIPRVNTTAAYVWVRARYQPPVGLPVYSATTPASSGQIAQSAVNAGTYAIATPTSAAASAASSSVTTGSVTASLVGATGTTFSWARQSGSTSISANSSSSATTSFSATSVPTGSTLSAVFRCTINGTYTVDVAVDCTNSGSALSVSTNVSSVSAMGSGASLTSASVTATASGGAGGTTYAWTKLSGGTITADTSSAAATTFSATGLAAGENRSAIFRVTATDSASATATADVSVTLSRSALSVSTVPASLYKGGTTEYLTTISVTATASGGSGSYTYAWTRVSGDATSQVCNSPASAVTTFTDRTSVLGLSGSSNETWRVTVTDTTTSATATADVFVTIENTSNQ